MGSVAGSQLVGKNQPMSEHERPRGLTIQVEVGDLQRARQLYESLLGAEAEFEPHEDLVEFRVIPGAEVWLQLVGVERRVRPLANRVRFGTDDLDKAHAATAGAGLAPGSITLLPGVVRFFDVADPWDNAVGFYQDIVPSGAQPVVGGSAHDESLFVTQQQASDADPGTAATQGRARDPGSDS